MSAELHLTKIKLGDNADTSKNFVISVPAVADGTLTIARENGTDVLTIDANGGVTGNIGLGANQTWQNVTASRTLETTYTNDTGRPIFISIIVQALGSNDSLCIFALSVNGVIVGESRITTFAGNSMRAQLTAVVPVGGVYSISKPSGSGSIPYWMELR